MKLDTTFDIRQSVFFIHDNKVEERTIDAISVQVNSEFKDRKYNSYKMEEYYFSNAYEIRLPLKEEEIGHAIIRKYANQIFATKDELLNSL